jgi:hypothetical protein
MNSQKIVSLADPVDPQDAATKAYVDAARSGLDVKASVRVATTENVTLATGGSGLTVLSTFTAELNSSGTSISPEAVIFRLNSEEGYAVPPTYSVNDLITITNAATNFGEGTDIDGVVLKVVVADPGEIIVQANDPLDATAFAAWSAAIAADGTANYPPPVVVSKVSLSSPTSGTTSVDGIELATGNRVLVKNQTNAAENGIYVVASSGSWLRATDADTSEKVTSGMFTFVSEGTVNADSGWVLTTNDTITLGTTGLTFAQFSGAGQITAGNGLTKTGNTIDAVGTANRITVNADSIDIASTYVGQTSITTLGTIATGTWQATDVGVAHGGTGASDAAGAKTNLGFMTRYAASNELLVPSSGIVSWTVTHSLGTKDVTVAVYDLATDAEVEVDVVRTSTTVVTLSWVASANVAADAYRVVVIG